MKLKYLLSISLFMLTVTLSAQKEFLGSWHMQEMTMEKDKKVDHISNEMLKQDGTIWEMKFSEGGKFYQRSNQNPANRMDEMDGTWKTEHENTLTIFLVINGQKLPLQFSYEFKDNSMILKRVDASRTQILTVIFKKK